MTEPVVEVIDAAAVGAHDHPLKDHDHADLRGEVAALRAEWQAAREAELAADSAAEATVAAVAAEEVAYDAQADLAALRAEMAETIEQVRAKQSTPVIMDNPAPVEEPAEPAPPEVDNKPRKKKSSGLSWF